MKLHLFLIVPAILIIISGCSNSGSVMPTGEISSYQSNPLPDGIGLLGRYELTVDTSTMDVELIPKRTTSVGESFTVSGLEYFNSSPCTNCLDLVVAGMDMTTGDFLLFFNLHHPFQEGDPGQPPSGINRLDLDIFDPALILWDFGGLQQTYFPLINKTINSTHISNAAGYTTELLNLIGDSAPAPYVLVVDDSLSAPPVTFNEFAMGEIRTFMVSLNFAPGDVLNFDLFLTFGYGASAVYEDRLNPEYYNPEFNRKAAWKVAVTPPSNLWKDNDSVTMQDVTVEVYDWQAGANVNPDLENYYDVYAASEVASVAVEIPGMTATLPIKTVPDSGSGTPLDPFIYTVSFANENLLGAGDYLGLVWVRDTRSPLTEADGRDFLIHTPDGKQRDHYEMPEYATYQVFETYIAVG